MNSIIIVNWVDKDFAERVLYSLERARYLRSEDYQCGKAHMQVWEKVPADNLRGLVLDGNTLDPIKLLPLEVMVQTIKARLAVYMPQGTKDWEVEHAAKNLIFDLMGKPG